MCDDQDRFSVTIISPTYNCYLAQLEQVVEKNNSDWLLSWANQRIRGETKKQEEYSFESVVSMVSPSIFISANQIEKWSYLQESLEPCG